MSAQSPESKDTALVRQPPPLLKKKEPYPFWLGGAFTTLTALYSSYSHLRIGVAATIAASITHPLDLTKVRLQASGDKRMIESIRKTVRTAGFSGLFDGITGTWMRQMSYSLCRFWAYDESKKIVGAGALLVDSIFWTRRLTCRHIYQERMHLPGNSRWQAVWVSTFG